jgi:hypothetical protein
MPQLHTASTNNWRQVAVNRFEGYFPERRASDRDLARLMERNVSEVLGQRDSARRRFGKRISAGLAAARRRGQISHGLFIKDADIVSRRPGANTRRVRGNNVAQSGAPVEVLALDWWSTVDGLSEHYRDSATMSSLLDALTGPLETTVWQQEAGFSEW